MGMNVTSDLTFDLWKYVFQVPQLWPKIPYLPTLGYLINVLLEVNNLIWVDIHTILYPYYHRLALEFKFPTISDLRVTLPFHWFLTCFHSTNYWLILWWTLMLIGSFRRHSVMVKYILNILLLITTIWQHSSIYIHAEVWAQSSLH